MSKTELTRRLVLCRSDQGDGGWSLHPAGTTDEAIADGRAVLLASGTAEWIDGQWDRPDRTDYTKALRDAEWFPNTLGTHYAGVRL